MGYVGCIPSSHIHHPSSEGQSTYRLGRSRQAHRAIHISASIVFIFIIASSRASSRFDVTTLDGVQDWVHIIMLFTAVFNVLVSGCLRERAMVVMYVVEVVFAFGLSTQRLAWILTKEPGMRGLPTDDVTCMLDDCLLALGLAVMVSAVFNVVQISCRNGWILTCLVPGLYTTVVLSMQRSMVNGNLMMRCQMCVGLLLACGTAFCGQVSFESMERQLQPSLAPAGCSPLMKASEELVPSTPAEPKACPPGSGDCISDRCHVLLPDGCFVSASEVEPGLTVQAMVTSTGVLRAARVKEVKRQSPSQGTQICCAHFESGTRITCTADHPFTSQSQGFPIGTTAKALKPGDIVKSVTVCEEVVREVETVKMAGEVVSFVLEEDGMSIFATDDKTLAALSVGPGPFQELTLEEKSRSLELPLSPSVRSVLSNSDSNSAFIESTESTMSSGGTTVVRLGFYHSPAVVPLSHFLEIPRANEGTLLSSGSHLHPGGCTPCWWLARPKGCMDGVFCANCHHPSHRGTYSSLRRNAGRRADGSTPSSRQGRQRAMQCAPSEPPAAPPWLERALGLEQSLHVGTKNTFLHFEPVEENPRGSRVRSHSDPGLGAAWGLASPPALPSPRAPGPVQLSIPL